MPVDFSQVQQQLIDKLQSRVVERQPAGGMQDHLAEQVDRFRDTLSAPGHGVDTAPGRDHAATTPSPSDIPASMQTPGDRILANMSSASPHFPVQGMDVSSARGHAVTAVSPSDAPASIQTPGDRILANMSPAGPQAPGMGQVAANPGVTGIDPGYLSQVQIRMAGVAGTSGMTTGSVNQTSQGFDTLLRAS